MAGWSPEQIAALILKWTTESPRQIAQELGRSRNAIIGKAHRLGLQIEARHLPKPPVKLPKPKMKKSDIYVPPPPPREIPAPENPVSLMDLESHHCRAIVGKDYDNLATYCGRDKIDGISYCAGHARIFYIQPKR